jgi:hypothetical protein
MAEGAFPAQGRMRCRARMTLASVGKY